MKGLFQLRISTREYPTTGPAAQNSRDSHSAARPSSLKRTGMGRARPSAHSRLSHQGKPDTSNPVSTTAKTSADTINPQRRISTHFFPV